VQFSKDYYGYYKNEDEIDGACGMYGGEEKWVQDTSMEIWRKETNSET